MASESRTVKAPNGWREDFSLLLLSVAYKRRLDVLIQDQLYCSDKLVALNPVNISNRIISSASAIDYTFKLSPNLINFLKQAKKVQTAGSENLICFRMRKSVGESRPQPSGVRRNL